MSQKDIDNIKQTLNDSVSKAYEYASGAEAQVNEATAQVSTNVRKSLSYGLEQFSHTKSRVQDASSTASAHIKSTEDQLLEQVRCVVKGGIQWCHDYPLFAYAGAASALLLFPAPRAFVFKNVFGVFQSQESAFRAATERFATLTESSKDLAKQKVAALESAKSALESLAEAHTKASAAARELTTLETQLSRTSTGFEEIRETTAPLKHKDVITLRSDVARTANEVRTDQKEILNMLSKLQGYQVS